MSKYVFLDIETQQSFDDVGGPFPNQMDISIGVTYDYINSYKSWNEKDASELLRYINTFEFIIGFNIIAFDYEVLSQYDHENLLSEFEYKTIDLLSLIESEIGKRISLNEIAKATLGKKKISSGKDAIKYWRNGEIQKLIAYCQKDVQLTVLLFEYVQKNEQLYCSSYGEKTVISIELPEEAKTIELNLLSTRTWLEAYFEALLSSDSISRKQILVLKENSI
jgi:DEAD/DEAH box helicase domain-containing protein